MKQITVVKKNINTVKVNIYVEDNVFDKLLNEQSDSIIEVSRNSLSIYQIDKARPGYVTISNVEFNKKNFEIWLNSYKEALEALNYDTFVEITDEVYDLVGEPIVQEEHSYYVMYAITCKKNKLRSFDLHKLRTLAHELAFINLNNK